MRRKKLPIADLRASYPVVELAELLSWDRCRTLRWLKRKGVPVDRTTGITSVWLSDLHRVAPEAWDSIVLVQSLRPGKTGR